MREQILAWLGFADHKHDGGHGHHHHEDGARNDHTHGVVDPSVATSERGIWAVKWSFVILAITAALQLVVVAVSGSVALFADTIHNIADAATAIPLWIAFALAKRPASPRFTYGYGRVEDLAGVAIVLIILFSAVVAGYHAIERLMSPEPIGYLGWVMAAGVIGFLGNEFVAALRIRVGREINSVALVADGYHARTDALTSLAVVAGAVGVWLGFPLVDPIVGLIITLIIFGIVWQSSVAVFTRLLDGVDPEVIAAIRHAAEHVPGLRGVAAVRARWLGHKLNAEIDVRADRAITLGEAERIKADLQKELLAHLPYLAGSRICLIADA